jgi:hypothetical protein
MMQTAHPFPGAGRGPVLDKTRRAPHFQSLSPLRERWSHSDGGEGLCKDAS